MIKIRYQFLGKLFFELVIVFAGVFGGFWLAGWNERQSKELRKKEIYLALQEDLERFSKNGDEAYPNSFTNLFREEVEMLDSIFQHKQIPPASLFLQGDYWHTEIIDMFVESGVIEELDIATIKKITRFHTIHQNFLQSIEHYNQYYNTHVTSNHHKGIEEFYDSQTKEVKGKYAAMRGYIRNVHEFSRLLVKHSHELQKDIKQKYL